jgi:hypothetical protein
MELESSVERIKTIISQDPLKSRKGKVEHLKRDNL